MTRRYSLISYSNIGKFNKENCIVVTILYEYNDPLEDYFGIFPCKFNVLSTIETIPMRIGSRFYPNYPKIDTTLKPEQVATLFIDTLIMSNLYLNGLGADFDGDQITVRGVFSIQANKSCEELMYKKQNFLDISGGLKRKTEKEAVQTLYQLTSDV